MREWLRRAGWWLVGSRDARPHDWTRWRPRADIAGEMPHDLGYLQWRECRLCGLQQVAPLREMLLEITPKCWEGGERGQEERSDREEG